VLPPFLTADLKAKDVRAKKDEKFKWAFETPKPEFNDLLTEQMDSHFSPEVKTLLFHGDFKKASISLKHQEKEEKNERKKVTFF